MNSTSRRLTKFFLLLIPILILAGIIAARWAQKELALKRTAAQADLEVKNFKLRDRLVGEREDAELKEATAEADSAEQKSRLNDKLMDEKEHHIGLTQGPAAEAAQKVRDFPNRTSETDEIFKDTAAKLNALEKSNVLMRRDVDSAIEEIRHIAFGPLHVQYVLLVRADDVDFAAAPGNTFEIPQDSSILAVAHICTDSGSEKPSPRDIALAKERGLPVYAVSQRRIWVALPNGEIRIEAK
jgi:hypothetical protein